MPARVFRRKFLQSGAAAVAGLAADRAGRGSAGEPPRPEAYREPAREVPIVERADVVVCGAGPAGVAAAVAAGRAGAKTRLLEACGCLGGTWTAGLLSWILDSGNKPGLMQEILAKLEGRGAALRYGGDVGYDVEQMKLLLEALCLEAGVGLQLHTRVVGAARDGKRLAMAITESKSGRQAWAGKVFVDATGDGDLAAQAGCRFDYGREGSGQGQPMSMMALLTGLDPEQLARFIRGLAEPRGKKSPKRRLLEELRRAGVEPSYAQPTLFYVAPGLFCLAANHQYGVSGTSAAHVTAATLAARAEVHKLVAALRSLGGAWKEARIVATPEHIGIREGRRVRGLYQVTREDLVRGASHEDAVCRVTFPVDVHSTDPQKDKGIMSEGLRARPYDIPLRALIACDVQGLLLAGRCISGDFLAHSSYRVTGNAVAMGEAAGVAAALAATSARLAQEVPWDEVRRALEAARRRRD